MSNENAKAAPVLPTILEYTGLVQLSSEAVLQYEDLNKLDQIESKSELDQIAESASNLADYENEVHAAKTYTITMSKDINRQAGVAANIFKTGSFKVSVQNSLSIVAATDLLTGISKSIDKYEVTTTQYNQLMVALSTEFTGNYTTAYALTQLFAIFNDVSVDIASFKHRIQTYHAIYNRAADIVQSKFAGVVKEELDAQ